MDNFNDKWKKQNSAGDVKDPSPHACSTPLQTKVIRLQRVPSAGGLGLEFPNGDALAPEASRSPPKRGGEGQSHSGTEGSSELGCLGWCSVLPSQVLDQCLLREDEKLTTTQQLRGPITRKQ